MQCPVCAQAELVRDTRDLPYTYQGESATISSVTGDFCPACGEAILDANESARVNRQMLEFNKEVNASFVSPEFIGSVREKLALSQKEAAEIFGGGVNAFSRYETGKARPLKALVKLLKLIDRVPTLLKQIRA